MIAFFVVSSNEKQHDKGGTYTTNNEESEPLLI